MLQLGKRGDFNSPIAGAAMEKVARASICWRCGIRKPHRAWPNGASLCGECFAANPAQPTLEEKAKSSEAKRERERPMPKVISSETKDHALADYRDGLSAEEVSKKYGLGKGTLYAWASAAGVKSAAKRGPAPTRKPGRPAKTKAIVLHRGGGPRGHVNGSGLEKLAAEDRLEALFRALRPEYQAALISKLPEVLS